MTDQSLTSRLKPAPMFSRGFARGIFRIIARLGNPPILLLVRRGLVPNFGLVTHRGRKCGQIFTTPVVVGVKGELLYIPVALGEHSQWFQNVRASGGCTVVVRGKAYRAIDPIVVDRSDAFAAPLRFILGLLGITQFLCLRSLPQRDHHA